MKLLSLFGEIPYAVLKKKMPLDEIEITSLTCNSKDVSPGMIFFCMEGTKADGHDYMEEAKVRGAEVLIVEKMVRGGKLLAFPEEVTILLVEDTRSAFARASAVYFSYPAKKLKVVGVTGTKGKTTVTHMIAALLEGAGHKTGVIGTLGIQIGNEQITTENTTPDAFTIQKYFAKMIEKECEYAVIEVSSQSMKQKRVEGILFEAAVFTNLSPDHIGPGEHKNMKEYRYYKSLLFKQARAVIGNLDDSQCSYMFHQTECEKYGYTCMDSVASSKGRHILKADAISYLIDENGPQTAFTVDGRRYHLRLPGLFNVYNALAALLTIRALGETDERAAERLEYLEVNGRMQRILTKKNVACYVDYAHNGESLKEVLQTMRQYHPRRILLAFGCGGGRSKVRRKEMGRVAGTYADITILTSDNPRMEDPMAIIQEILLGIKETEGSYRIIPDRREAVRKILKLAGEGDLVIIAGKGHEDYQEIDGIRYPLSDVELIKMAEE